MTEPQASRPHMPGYGVLAPDEGAGLLPWSWALQRLRDSRNYWLSTVQPSGRPHTMPVWALWHDNTLWFSSGLHSRKIRNIQARPDVSIATEDATKPVVLDGSAKIVTDEPTLRWFLDTLNAKYDVDLAMKHVDPTTNATVVVTPRWVFGVEQGDMGGSSTKWTFG